MAVGKGNQTLLWIGIVLGVGAAGTLDGVILHELLQWHRFYVHTTRDWQVFIDGFFHLATAGLLFVGALLVYRERAQLARSAVSGKALLSGLFLGMGGFNLFDGVVDHKVLRLHPVRVGVQNIFPYDVVYIGVALAILAVGWFLWRDVRGKR